MTQRPDAAEDSYPCPRCQLGNLQPHLVTFSSWYAGQFITVPKFPGWVCDVCGAREYDSGALEHLQSILGPDADLRRERSRRSGRSIYLRPAPPSRSTTRGHA
jgi:YgiT-type zinc finger domain-containing protein